MKIYLIGMPGCGKSTLGKKLAEKLSFPFIELDQEIEKDAKKNIPRIFEEDGEEIFREKEANLLREFSNDMESFVMSTGGGAPCYRNGIGFMNSSGITIYLKVSARELTNRLKEDNDYRPLLAQHDSLKQRVNDLLSGREEFYNRASITLESDSISITDLERVLKI